MKKSIFMMLVAATILASCHTQSSLSDYDVRPTNKQPVLERPAWPNYDLHDDRSFAAFSQIQTAPETNKNNIAQHDGYTLYRCKEATYLCFDYQIPTYQDWWFFRFTKGSAIIDADTGDRYLLQHMEHFPTGQCFWIYGQSGETIRIVGVYPPLPLSVKRVQIYEASAQSRRWMNGTGSLTRPYEVDDLRPQPQHSKKKSGRIIR